MDVSDILRDRMHEPAGLQRMVAVSIAAHVLFAAALLLTPARFLGREAEAPRTIMTISLAGGGTADSGGMTPMGGRAVQVQTSPEEATKPQPVRPPAAKAPEMVLPRRDVKVNTKNSPAPKVTQAPDDARGRTPSRGAQTAKGSTSAETLVRGQGFGLSSGGGPGGGSRLDVGDFCCPEYIQTMVQRIRSIWQMRQGVDGEVNIKFTIQRDGRITDTSVEKSSGNIALDLAARRAVAVTQLPPLPDAFPNSTLGVHLNFQYQK